MGKSFYYLVSWEEAPIFHAKLDLLEFPYTIEDKEEQIAFVFSELSSRQERIVKKLFAKGAVPYS